MSKNIGIGYTTTFNKENAVAQTPEERKIKRLEKQVAELKNEVSNYKLTIRNMERSLMCERQWRMDFQKLLKVAAFEDNLTDIDKEYW